MFFRKKKETTPVSTVKAVYVMAITAEKMPADALMSAVKAAQAMLTQKNPTFAKLFGEQMQPQSKIEVANIKYAGSLMHTPQTMQTTLIGWVKNQYNVDVKLVVNKNFFPHGMFDAQKRENFFLFYFDIKA